MNKISIKGCQFAYEIMGTGSPTVVLETGIGAESSEWGASALNMPFIPDASARQRLQLLWDELQADLSHLSDNRRTDYLEKSGHFVQRDDPVVLEGAQIDLQQIVTRTAIITRAFSCSAPPLRCLNRIDAARPSRTGEGTWDCGSRASCSSV